MSLWENLAVWFDGVKTEFILNFVARDRWKLLVTGLENTLLMTFFALCIGIMIGVAIAVIRTTWDTNKDKMKHGAGRFLLSLINRVCVIYTTVIRGTPVVVQLLIIYFVIFSSVNISKVVVAVLAFGLNSGAYVSEIVRSGIMSIDIGQLEAGRSLGVNYTKTMIYIIMPQAFKNVLPALGNEFITLLKETSVAGYIALQDLTKAGDLIRSRTFSAFMPLIAVALIYLGMVGFFTWLLGKLERRLRDSER